MLTKRWVIYSCDDAPAQIISQNAHGTAYSQEHAHTAFTKFATVHGLFVHRCVAESLFSCWCFEVSGPEPEWPAWMTLKPEGWTSPTIDNWDTELNGREARPGEVLS